MKEQKDIVPQWLERVDYDLGAAAGLLKSGHLLYVAFLCQQAIEKILKASWCQLRADSPPYTHNLATLSETLNLNLSGSHQILLDRLNSYYIVGRYPSFKQRLASELSKKDAVNLLKETEEFVKWCKKFTQMLKK